MRIRSGWLLGLALLAPAPASAGNWFATQWNGWCSQYRTNRDWPEQHLDHDRAAARAPFALMVANGWRCQNTVSSYHFHESTGELNEPGKLKVRAILTNTPPQYRSLHVLQADSAELTDARVRAVQDYSQAITRDGFAPPVMVTGSEPIGTSGAYVDGVYRRREESFQPPILPPIQRPTEN